MKKIVFFTAIALFGFSFYVVYKNIDSVETPNEDTLSSPSVSENKEISEPESGKNTLEKISFEELPSTNPNSPYPSFSEILLPDDEFPSVPYGNGRGVVILSDALLTLHASEGELLATRHLLKDGQVLQEKIVLDTSESGASGFISASSLQNEGDTVLAVWINITGIKAAFSDNGGKTWNEDQLIGPRTVGPATPTSCVWTDDEGELQALTAWVSPPDKEDGGPLHFSRWNGTSWSDPLQVGELELVSSPSLTCNKTEQSMIMRNGETKDLHLYFTKSIDEGETWEEPKEITRGADPNLDHCGDHYWVAYHYRGSQIIHSSDGGTTWLKYQLDDTGKFESVACQNELVAVSWGDYESVAAANQKSSPRQIGAAISIDNGQSWYQWRPVGDETNQSTSSMDAENGTVVLFWRVPNYGLRVATWSQ